MPLNTVWSIENEEFYPRRYERVPSNRTNASAKIGHLHLFFPLKLGYHMVRNVHNVQNVQNG